MENGINMYLKEICEFPILSFDEEQELSKNIKASLLNNNLDHISYDKLVNCNLRLVIGIAKKYRNLGLEFEDLVCEGNAGLMYAAKHYDGEAGFRFSTYASSCIENYILRALHNLSKLIRIPSHCYQEMSKIKQAKINYYNDNNKEPSNAEISDIVGISIERIEELYNMFKNLKSLDEKVDEDHDLHEIIASDSKTPLENCITSDISNRIKSSLSELNDRERFVIESRMGFNGKELSLREIGETLNVSRERVRQIEAKALIKLKKIISKYGINCNIINSNLN